MRIAITGGTGLIGSHLTEDFVHNGDEVVLISRACKKQSRKTSTGQERVSCIIWDQIDNLLTNDLKKSKPMQREWSQLEGLDAVINLAGETINQRWTKQAKRRILDSRIESTRKIAQLVDQLVSKPKVVINGSAIGLYGTSLTETFDENSSIHENSTTQGNSTIQDVSSSENSSNEISRKENEGNKENLTNKDNEDFLSEVVKQWEQAANFTQGCRLVKLRTGVVLSADGGALPRMVLPYKFGVGGRVGSGKQWISWIHIKDLVKLIRFCIEDENIIGPVNGTSPHPVTNDQFGKTISRTMLRPHLFPVPEFILKLIFGEMSSLLLKGQEVLPKAAVDQGFSFTYPTIDNALRDIL